MAVRRLAEETIQPSRFQFSRDNAAWAEATIRKYPEGRQHSAVIPLLMRAQDQEGWVTRAAIERVADMLAMPYIRALEVATFYTQFQLKPVGSRAHVQVCGTTPCMLRGSEDLKAVCRKKIGEEPLEPNADGTLSWEEVECQGACVNAPMVMIGRDTYEDLTPERLEEILQAFDAGKGDTIPVGPQIDRIRSAPVGGLTTLNDNASSANAPKAGSKPTSEAAGSAPPSKAGRPETAAPETDPSINSPSPEKVDQKDEDHRSPDTPADQNSTMKVAGSARPRAPKRPRTAGSAGKTNSTMAIAHSARGGSAGSSERPEAIDRPQSPDDLKTISGIGPKIEEKLHGLGVWTFEQIAAWKKAESDWIDAELSFHGRIEREDWVKQAKALVKKR